MQDAPIIASNLSCQHCGWPLVKNGELKCKRSGHTVQATLGRGKIFCPYCRKPKVLLVDAKNQAICPQCSKRTLITLKEQKMTQQTVAETSGVQEQKKSKTQELRDWLDGEIESCKNDMNIIGLALCDPKGSYVSAISGVHDNFVWLGRYMCMTSDERDARMKEDRTKLEELQKRLELLRSARELDVDIDGLEKAGVEVLRAASHDTTFDCHYRIDETGCRFQIDAGRRYLTIQFFMPGTGTVSRSIFNSSYDSVISFKVQSGFPGWMDQTKIVLSLPSNDYLVICH